MRLTLRIKVKKAIFRNGETEVPATLYYPDYYDVKVLLAVFFYKVLIERLNVSPRGHLFDKSIKNSMSLPSPSARRSDSIPMTMLSIQFMPLS